MTTLPSNGQKPRILIVDDEPSQLDALERTLRRDFATVRASSGEEALRLLASGPDFAVVLCDLRMPGMGGLAALAECRRLAPAAVRAAISGAIDVAGMAEAINSGAIDKFVLKPWEPEYLRVQMLEALSRHEARRERAILERLASTDSLTEVANRRHFDERLRVELDRASRHSRPMALLLIDVDSFKALNDRLGHAEGDAILKRVAAAIGRRVRKIDFVARFGGDEFAVIMPDAASDAAALVAERIRAEVEAGPPPQATVSVGVAGRPVGAVFDQTKFLEAADSALYRAKGQGRNQIAVAPLGPLLP